VAEGKAKLANEGAGAGYVLRGMTKEEYIMLGLVMPLPYEKSITSSESFEMILRTTCKIVFSCLQFF